MSARDTLRKMALSLATGTGPIVEPKAFDVAIDAYRAAVLLAAADKVDTTELPDDYIDTFDSGAQWATAELRREAGTKPTTQPPTHLAKGTNAEDCPACKGTNPDYPFLCPGPATT